MTILKKYPRYMLILLCVGLCFASALVLAEGRTDDIATLTITTRQSPVTFRVEVARNHASQANGLMFRKSMPEDAGMLFVYGEPQRIVRMWMRNTLIPLDMLFIDARGVIVHLHENAKPRDETVISSRYNVSSVVELNGGMIKKHGISVGDTVSLIP
jgi:uncharacterized protein